MSSRRAVQKLLEESGLREDEDYFLGHSVRELVCIDIAVQAGDQRIAFMKSLPSSTGTKLALLGWRAVKIPPENRVTRQWVNAILEKPKEQPAPPSS